jgi:WhiB family redox-sensing transcriptional regulator
LQGQKEKIMGDQPENFGTPAAIASSTLGVPTAIDRGTLQTELDKLRFREKTAPALPPIQRTLEDGTSTFNKNERSTITALDALGELDRAAHCLDELADALACSSSPQWDAARCRHIGGSASTLFFSDDIGDVNEAKRICSGCPMAVPCVQGALDRQEPCGVWGGHLFSNGQILAHKRARGRPPKGRPAPSTTQRTIGWSAPEPIALGQSC